MRPRRRGLADTSFRALFDGASESRLIADQDGRIVRVNGAAEELFGYARDELLGRKLQAVLPDLASGEVELRRKDGGSFMALVTLSEVATCDGLLRSLVIRDVTAGKRAAEALAYQATHDALTGLPNRALFLDRLDHALARARRSAGKVAVVFLDLDDFKIVNDTCGHAAGDAVLVGLAPRLAGALRPGDTIARFGGDEFVVLCEDLAGGDDAIQIGRRIIDACREPFRIGPCEHTLTASVGVALVADAHSAAASEVVHDADAAMYRSKARGGGCVELFDEGMRGAATALPVRRRRGGRRLGHDRSAANALLSNASA
jgi:diguanylate cyclase (GGDEF)-like protein